MREIAVKPIEAEAFLPFGFALGTVSQALTPRNLRPGAEAVIEKLEPRGPTGRELHVVELLERHPFSTQTFIPIGVATYLVVVASSAADGSPNLTGLRAFRVPGSMIVQYHAAVWHAPLTALDPAGSFAMHVHRDGSSGDTEFLDISPVAIRLEITGRTSTLGRSIPAASRPRDLTLGQEIS